MGIGATLSPTAAQLVSFGLDPAWSKRVTIEGFDGAPVDLHVLDTGGGQAGTVVCVHGNPTWGYLWRDLLETLPPTWRVLAIDQASMGYSERVAPRRLADRVAELVTFCRQEVSGPLVLAAHDWGGPIAVGATASLDVEALILANTAVAKPDDVAVPPLIALARRAVDLVCRRTPLFVGGTAAMTERRHRAALRAPYKGSDRRQAVADFVADIPVRPGEPSWSALERSAAALGELHCPILLLWGGRDPVFHDRFLADLRRRAPAADVERFSGAGHLVPLDEPIGSLVASWLDRLETPTPHLVDPAGLVAPGAVVASRADDDRACYVGPDGMLSWAELSRRSALAAAHLIESGVAKGTRVSLLIPPSPELLIAACATWRAGGVPVVADASGGLRQLRRLVRAAAPSAVIGTPATLSLAAALRLAPRARRFGFTSAPGVVDLRAAGAAPLVEPPTSASDPAAVVHTSGATGPAKAVCYSHGALAAQREAIVSLLDLGPDDAFTTSFGAFVLLAPLLGSTCVRPDFDVSAPSELGFDELAAACSKARVTTAWLSPASAETILATASGRRLALGLVLVAGAPVATSTLTALAELTGGDVRSPYGMTELLPATDGLREVEGSLGGVGVGRPLPGVTTLIAPLDDPAGELAEGEGWGEILLGAPWMFEGYDASWSAEHASSVERAGRRLHRTGDVGYLEGGQLFVLGRRAHVIESSGGPLASVAVEEPIAAALGRAVAAVGVGPSGAQVVAVVLSGTGKLRLADQASRASVRAAAPCDVAAVLEGALPVDHRHQSKVDRSALSRQAAELLAGR